MPADTDRMGGGPVAVPDAGKAGHMAKGSSVFTAEVFITEVTGEYRRTVARPLTGSSGGYV